ncbi:S-adenosyl-L-methionine-dependent methyltransferase [Schizophyllum amplum]|uniref:S-adenosyl-L-methionine-dependent methyltransferase n=1 Tax=Schizophyllum amplum TaxID=97359 RepID=A0A550C7H0_9AGAR|nr:S-adenosyl-L-methionine-dependent methyltransferase [Auriculariopsis ampla]
MSKAVLPDKNEEYGTKAYWDARYSKEAEEPNFDWCQNYANVAETFRELIPDKAARILMLGCGNSKLSEDMWDDGYHNIVNVDYSPVVIEQMCRRHGVVRPQMEWHEMDIRELRFDDASFDVAIDKATMDAMLTYKGDPWNPPKSVVNDCMREVDEVVRVLRPGGIFIYLTFGQPHFRRRYLAQRPGTTLDVRELGDTWNYYLYMLRKQ